MKLVLGATLFAAAIVPMAAHAADYATVISSTPVTATVNVPRRVCTEGQQFVQAQPSGAGAVIGAIAGGVLGNAVGAGFGRAAATGLGVVAGAAIGNNVEANAANAYPPTAVPVQRCQMVSAYEPRTVGYDVVYEYAGQRYTTRLARDPGPRVAVSVAAADQPQPMPYAESAQPQAIYEPAPVVYAGPPLVYVSPFIGYGYGYRGRWR